MEYVYRSHVDSVRIRVGARETINFYNLQALLSKARESTTRTAKSSHSAIYAHQLPRIEVVGVPHESKARLHAHVDFHMLNTSCDFCVCFICCRLLPSWRVSGEHCLGRQLALIVTFLDPLFLHGHVTGDQAPLNLFFQTKKWLKKQTILSAR